MDVQLWLSCRDLLAFLMPEAIPLVEGDAHCLTVQLWRESLSPDDWHLPSKSESFLGYLDCEGSLPAFVLGIPYSIGLALGI